MLKKRKQEKGKLRHERGEAYDFHRPWHKD
jgi:hypothetical protein